MIKKNLLKKFAKEQYNKKIGEIAIKKIDAQVKEVIKEILNKASRKADISGRISIKEQDI